MIVGTPLKETEWSVRVTLRPASPESSTVRLVRPEELAWTFTVPATSTSVWRVSTLNSFWIRVQLAVMSAAA